MIKKEKFSLDVLENTEKDVVDKIAEFPVSGDAEKERIFRISEKYFYERIAEDTGEEVEYTVKRKKILASGIKNSKIHVKKSFIRFIAAVSAVIMISGLTVAGTVWHNREDTLTSLEGDEFVKFVEENNITFTDSAENSHIRVYLDSVVSDGKLCRINYCFEALDKKCLKLFREADKNDSSIMRHLYLCYSDNYTLVTMSGITDDRLFFNNDNQIYFSYIITVDDIDLTRPVSLNFAAEAPYIADPYNPDNFFRDIDIPVDLSPNIASLVIADEYGTEMRMSQLGIYFDRSAKDLAHSGIRNIVLYYSDGHETQINNIGVHTRSGDGEYTGILYTDHQLIDIDNCTKVKIGERVFNVIG